MRTVSIGNQGFASMREGNCFYVDKTDFIREWWENQDIVTLITRPRRFGKTLNMGMLECFFSRKYAGRGDLFEGLSIWEDEKYRNMQGAYPVISLSFANVKEENFALSRRKICQILSDLYSQNHFLLEGCILDKKEKMFFDSVSVDMDDVTATLSVHRLSEYLSRHYGKKTLIFLDEYDAPMQEAYLHGYWEEMASFIRSMFNAAFKTNPSLERAVMTGVTRVSKESIFSDLNNLRVVTTTSNTYASAFGFTEQEVFAALDEAGMSGERERVREWYDGFTFGRIPDIYNPWSITNLLKEKEYQTYWASSSSNGLVSRLVQTGNASVKQRMERLLKGETICAEIDEQIIFSQLDETEDAIWSLLLAGGYLKVAGRFFDAEEGIYSYELRLTNKEVFIMFRKMIRSWFGRTETSYDGFTKALVQGDLEAMNYYMNHVVLDTFSFFDVVGRPSGRVEPERFYHGFVLGLMVSERENYQIKSNRESGFGRYDILLVPRGPEAGRLPGIVLEFKVRDPRRENTLEDTVAEALRQIAEKDYDAELRERGIEEWRIRHYGFAFEGKQVLIGTTHFIPPVPSGTVPRAF